MPGITLTVDRLRKDFGAVRAVDDLSFTVAAGRVTGFLGPNGAGKTTTLRCLLGLVTPTSGTATIDGRRYDDLPRPLQVVGAALEATGFHPGRRANDHLRILATASGVRATRVSEVLDLVGLGDVADRRVGGFSLGMRQRLQLAATLLGDPPVLVLDEPANGLDPEGIVWLRSFLRHLAGEGRTVLVSSHVLSEVEQTVDDVVIIAGGRLVREGPLADLRSAQGSQVVVRGPDLGPLRAALAATGLGQPREQDDHALVVDGVTAADVGHLAHAHGVELHELSTRGSELEDIFLSLTSGAAEPAQPADVDLDDDRSRS